MAYHFLELKMEKYISVHLAAKALILEKVRDECRMDEVVINAKYNSTQILFCL